MTEADTLSFEKTPSTPERVAPSSANLETRGAGAYELAQQAEAQARVQLNQAHAEVKTAFVNQMPEHVETFGNTYDYYRHTGMGRVLDNPGGYRSMHAIQE